jgi:hypothetical protein
VTVWEYADDPLQVAHLFAQSPAMYAELEADLELLRRLEWVKVEARFVDSHFFECQCCWSTKGEGHAPDCALDARIKSIDALLTAANPERGA